MDGDADAKMILMAPPPDNWKRTPGCPRITWLNTVQCNLRAYSLTLNEAVDLAQNRPLRRLMSTYGVMHSYWCMTEKEAEVGLANHNSNAISAPNSNNARPG